MDNDGRYIILNSFAASNYTPELLLIFFYLHFYRCLFIFYFFTLHNIGRDVKKKWLFRLKLHETPSFLVYCQYISIYIYIHECMSKCV